MRVADEGRPGHPEERQEAGRSDRDHRRGLAVSLLSAGQCRLYDTFAGAVVALQNGDVFGVVINGGNGPAYEQEFAGKLIVGIKDLQADPLGRSSVKAIRWCKPSMRFKQITADGTLEKCAQNTGTRSRKRPRRPVRRRGRLRDLRGRTTQP